jgi:hypothetical protein
MGLDLLALLLVFPLLCWWCDGALVKYRFDRRETFQAASRFIERMQNPANCTGLEYVVVSMGCGGGFAAHFQLAASEWMRVAKAVNYSKPVLIVGHIRGYSDGPECEHANKDWTCFFEPMSSSACQSELLRSGKQVGPRLEGVRLDDSLLPADFSHVGFAWWWGFVQARMFRMRPEVEKLVLAEGARMDGGRGFPLSNTTPVAVAGLHVRHGDKSSDGFKHHSFEAEVAAVRKSPECINISSCIVTLNDTLSTSTSTPPQPSNPSPKAVRLFVASDDASVLVSARVAGHLVKEAAGVSTQTSTAGMFKTLMTNKAVAYNATVEIITDVFYLSHCSTLVGILASQVFRLAAGMSNATGVLQHAAVMDYSQLGKVKRMSERWSLPLPEDFSPA